MPPTLSSQNPLPPGSTIGILGGGQLGRMLAMAAARLGLRARVFADRAEDPSVHVTANPVVAAYDDVEAVAAFAAGVDLVTYEFENVSLALAAAAAGCAPLAPSARSLDVTQDRLHERRFLADLEIACAPWRAVETVDDLIAAQAALGGATILKSRRLGYDGKGQARLAADADPQDCALAYDAIARTPAILEARIPFEREVSVVLTRGHDGEIVAYDVTENVHRDGILHTSQAPADVSAEVASQATQAARQIAEALGHVGTMAVEFFVLSGDDEPSDADVPRLLVNEMAPRVHNSGHWTLDATVTDQFENHVRAICGWPLGPTSRLWPVEMTNLIGADVDAWQQLAAEPDATLHLYGKRDARPGRKMGHVTRRLSAGR